MAERSNHRDCSTGSKLSKGFHVHHLKMGQEIEGYSDLTNESEFMALNPYSHKLLHYLFTHYKKDKQVIGRLVEVLERMSNLLSSEQTNPQPVQEDVKEKQV